MLTPPLDFFINGTWRSWRRDKVLLDDTLQAKLRSPILTMLRRFCITKTSPFPWRSKRSKSREWPEKVYEPDIVNRWDNVYKRAGGMTREISDTRSTGNAKTIRWSQEADRRFFSEAG